MLSDCTEGAWVRGRAWTGCDELWRKKCCGLDCGVGRAEQSRGLCSTDTSMVLYLFLGKDSLDVFWKVTTVICLYYVVTSLVVFWISDSVTGSDLSNVESPLLFSHDQNLYRIVSAIVELRAATCTFPYSNREEKWKDSHLD